MRFRERQYSADLSGTKEGLSRSLQKAGSWEKPQTKSRGSPKAPGRTGSVPEEQPQGQGAASGTHTSRTRGARPLEALGAILKFELSSQCKG